MNSKDRMLAYVNQGLRDVNYYNDIMSAEGAEIDRFFFNAQNLTEQYFVEKANWGLEQWELFLGIPIDKTKPDSFRRSTIIAKIRGTGVVTVEMIKNVAESFANGEVEVIENLAPYTFKIKFVGVLGAPPNIEDLFNAINEIKPAHMSVVYEYRYLLINQVHNVLKINEIQQRKLTDFSPFLPVVEGGG